VKENAGVDDGRTEPRTTEATLNAARRSGAASANDWVDLVHSDQPAPLSALDEMTLIVDRSCGHRCRAWPALKARVRFGCAKGLDINRPGTGRLR